MQQFIGCDAHKKFSVFVAVDERGKASRPVRVEHKGGSVVLGQFKEEKPTALDSTGFPM